MRTGFTALVLVGALASSIGLSAVWADESLTGKIPPPPPMPPASHFVDEIDNAYLPLKPGTTLIYHGKTDEGREVDTFAVTEETKEILGVEATVVFDYVMLNGRPKEKTFDWFAQDKDGNVWYLGEDSFDWVHGTWVKNDGSWEAGVDGAQAGIVMEAIPKVGDTYRQEYYQGHAEDVARVLSTTASVTVPYGRFTRAVETRDWTPLDPGIVEHKYFARGIGEVKAVKVKGGTDIMVLVAVTHKEGK